MVNPTIAVLIIIIAIGAAVVYAVFTQQVPSSTVPPETVSSSCTSIVTTTVLTPNAGAVQYTCTGGTQAFNTVAGVSTPQLTGYTACPVGTVTSPCYTNFGYVPHGDTTSCAPTTGTGFHQITSTGTTSQITFTAGAWDYCSVYAAPSTGGSLPGFSISWS